MHQAHLKAHVVRLLWHYPRRVDLQVLIPKPGRDQGLEAIIATSAAAEPPLGHGAEVELQQKRLFSHCLAKKRRGNLPGLQAAAQILPYGDLR